ncbi:hypothetical protein [Micromonospora sp. NPDC005197]|uniref:hypothetical protein n=1 Tax=Micromonospora sp. NPDC005197 TaxID=3157020 RepID=UPI0033A5E960
MTTTRRGGIAGPVGGDWQASRPPTRQRGGGALPADSPLARELLDGLAEAVLTTDETGRVTLVNARAAQLLPEIVAGVELSECPVAALARALQDGTESFDAEHHGRHLRGGRRRTHRAEPLAGRRGRGPERRAPTRVRPAGRAAGQPDARSRGVSRCTAVGPPCRPGRLRPTRRRAGPRVRRAGRRGAGRRRAVRRAGPPGRVLQTSLLPPELPTVPGGSDRWS